MRTNLLQVLYPLSLSSLSLSLSLSLLLYHVLTSPTTTITALFLLLGIEPDHTSDPLYAIKSSVLEEYKDAIAQEKVKLENDSNKAGKKASIKEEQKRVRDNSMTTLKNKKQRVAVSDIDAIMTPASTSTTSSSSSRVPRTDLIECSKKHIEIAESIRADNRAHQKNMENLLERSVSVEAQRSKHQA